MNKVLSLIIPTYNMEKYLNRCLLSLVIEDASVFALLEVLVVIDGATDNSAKIARSFSKKYPGVFRVIEKENGNYGSCINRGLAEATGKYVKVLDADDWFDTDGFERYLKKLSVFDVDLVLNNCTKVDEAGKCVGNFCISKIKPDAVVPFLDIREWAVSIQMHCVAYRLSMLRQISYTQTEGISYTDQQWVAYPMAAVKDVAFCNINLYQYLVGRSGQTMDKMVLTKKFCDEERMVLDMLGWWKKENCKLLDYEYLKKKIQHHIVYLYQNHLLEGLYETSAFRAFSSKLKRDFSVMYDLLEKENICRDVEYKYIKEFHENENYRIPGDVLRKLRSYKRRQKIKIVAGTVLRKLGLRT